MATKFSNLYQDISKEFYLQEQKNYAEDILDLKKIHSHSKKKEGDLSDTHLGTPFLSPEKNFEQATNMMLASIIQIAKHNNLSTREMTLITAYTTGAISALGSKKESDFQSLQTTLTDGFFETFGDKKNLIEVYIQKIHQGEKSLKKNFLS